MGPLKSAWRGLWGRSPFETPVGLLLVAPLIALGASLPASAQTLRVDEASLGFLTTTPRGPQLLRGAVEGVDAWLPCEVVLTNASGRTYTGTFELVEGRRSVRSPIRYSHRVTLGPGARQRLSFPVLYDASCGYGLSFTDDETGLVPLVQGRSTASLSKPVQRPVAEKFVLVARKLGDEGRGLGHLQPLSPRNEVFDKPREWSLAQIDPRLLPERGILYHRVDALVLDDIALDRLTPGQQSAILEFVARGGLLWVSLLTGRPGAQSALLQAALPGRLWETRELKEVRALEAFTGVPCQLLRPKTFMTFRRAPDAVAWDAEDPVVLHRRYERGWIVLAGFRFGERHLAEPLTFLRELLSIRESPAIEIPGAYDRRLRNALRSSLRWTTKKAVPPLFAVVVLIVAYLLCAVALPFFLMRRSGRLERAWLAVAGMSLVGTGAVMLMGDVYSQPTRAVRVGFVTGGAHAGPHLRTSFLAVFSKDGGVLPLTFANPGAVAFPYDERSSLGSDRPALTWADGERVALATHPQDTSLLITNEPCELAGGLRFRMTSPRQGRLENRGRSPLLGAWAFDAQGDGLPLTLPRGMFALSEEQAQAHTFKAPLEAAKEFVALLAQRRGRPMLVYAYEGERVLEDHSEVSLDLGVLEVDGWSGGMQQELPSLPREVASAGGREDYRIYTFTARIPEGMVVEDVLVEWWLRGFGRAGAQGSWIYDWKGGRWERLSTRVSGRARATSADVQDARKAAQPLWRTPLGLVRGRIRVGVGSNFEPRVRLLLKRKAQ